MVARRTYRIHYHLGHQGIPLRFIEVHPLPARRGAGRQTKKAFGRLNPGGVETEGTHALGIIGSNFEKEITA
jgi:hypothetical protein